MKHVDVMIAGAGLAGLYCALSLPKELSVLVLSKSGVTGGNSALAQGGVAAVIDPLGDDFSHHIEDTMRAGRYENDNLRVKTLVEEGPEDIAKLLSYGVEFDRGEDGEIALALEGGHSRRRIAHHKDSTGLEIVTRLAEQVSKAENITLLENHALLRMKHDNGSFYTHVRGNNNTDSYYTTKLLVLATGGIGRIWKYSTNADVCTGDGIRFAYEAGARVRRLSCVQFHPTAFVTSNVNAPTDRCFLISEAVRGEGAYLLNCRKERFMQKYEPERQELAPRDVVSECIMREQKETNSRNFYIDISHKDADFVKARFPLIYERLMKYGFDMTKEPVPVYPCQHYLMGGIDANEYGETTVPNLYAAGECAHTGVHGANRLASNSLLEALVFSRRIAENISDKIKCDPTLVQVPEDFEFVGTLPFEGDLSERLSELRDIMQKTFFVGRDIAAARKNLPRVREMYYDLLELDNKYSSAEFTQSLSAACTAMLVLTEIEADVPRNGGFS